MVHSFDGSSDELARVLQVDGLSIGINGCSLKTEENVRVAASVPIDKLMIETGEGERNEGYVGAKGVKGTG